MNNLRAALAIANALDVEFGAVDPKFVQALRKRISFGSSRNTQQWAGVPQALRDRLFFSATVSNATVLDKMKHFIASDLAGIRRSSPGAKEPEKVFGREKFVAEMRKALGIPVRGEKDSGKLTDIRSSRRLRLIYDFQKERTKAEATAETENDADHRELFPYREFVREEPRREPRNWIRLWKGYGGKLTQGRMIALRDDPIWRKLNRFGWDHAPWDFNSGMDTRWISRSQARRLGLPLPKKGASAEVRREVPPVPNGTPFDGVAARENPEEYFREYRSPESFPSENDRRLYAQGLYTLLAGNTAEQARNMSRDERRAVWGYTVYSGDINPALRGERVEKPFKDLTYFESAMKNVSFPMAKVAHRSASLAEIKNRFGGELSELASGDEANYPNAFSMSGFKKFASSPEVQMIIEIPKGAHAIYLDPLSEKGPFKRSGKSWDGNPRAPQTLWQSDSEANTESEILAAPGTKLKVVSVDAENKILRVRIEL